MRRSLVLSRGAKGYNWYNLFVERGADGFRKNVPPTPFDWSAGAKVRPCAFFELKIESEPLGRVEIELAEDVVPATVENFRRLCEGKGVKFPGYKGTALHQVHKGQFILGGDVSNQQGAVSHSSYADRHIKDENFIIPHSARGLLSMASVGVHSGGSQFYITLAPTPHLNGRCVAFGRVVKGLAVLETIEKLFCFRGVPARAISVEACGVYMPEKAVVPEGAAPQPQAGAKDKDKGKDKDKDKEKEGKGGAKADAADKGKGNAKAAAAVQ